MRDRFLCLFVVFVVVVAVVVVVVVATPNHGQLQHAVFGEGFLSCSGRLVLFYSGGR